MEKTYKEIDLCGVNLETIGYELLENQAKGELAYCNFNGVKLYGDKIKNIDDVYIAVFGITKKEFLHKQELQQIEYEIEHTVFGESPNVSEIIGKAINEARLELKEFV